MSVENAVLLACLCILLVSACCFWRPAALWESSNPSFLPPRDSWDIQPMDWATTGLSVSLMRKATVGICHPHRASQSYNPSTFIWFCSLENPDQYTTTPILAPLCKDSQLLTLQSRIARSTSRPDTHPSVYCAGCSLLHDEAMPVTAEMFDSLRLPNLKQCLGRSRSQ